MTPGLPLLPGSKQGRAWHESGNGLWVNDSPRKGEPWVSGERGHLGEAAKLMADKPPARLARTQSGT